MARRPCRSAVVHRLALAALLLTVPAAAAARADAVPDAAVKAAFLFNFAKFTDWQAVPASAPILICVIGDEEIATAFVTTVRGQLVGGHTLELSRPAAVAGWRGCHVLFIGDVEFRRSAAGLDALRALPVLTVSDSKGFAQAAGIIELYPEAGKMRFAINVDAAERCGVHISSRLLGLAKIVRSNHVQ